MPWPSTFIPPANGVPGPTNQQAFYGVMYIGGIPCFTKERTLIVTRAGRAHHSESVSGRGNVQRGQGFINKIQASPYPTVETDSHSFRQVLRQAHIIPLVLPDGAAYPVFPEQPGNALDGFYENLTDSYTVTYRVDPRVIMADLPWRGTLGQYAFSWSQGSGNALFTSGHDVAGSVTLVQDTGWRLAVNNSGSNTNAYIIQNYWQPLTQPMLACHITVEANTTCAVGFGQVQNLTRPLLGGGVGVIINQNAVISIGDLDTQSTQATQVSGSAGHYWLYVTPRVGGARIDVWKDGQQVLVANRVPYAAIQSNLTPVITCTQGGVTLNQWWARRT